MTRWAGAPDAAAVPLDEYPRPQMVREPWLNLNGMWDFAVADRAAGPPTGYGERIRVPFAPESALSLIGRRIAPEQRVWYRRTFSVPAAWADQRVLLHLGAVNWEAQVQLNGRAVGQHTGGYDGWEVDLTDALVAGADQVLTISAWNPVEGGQPRGKQAVKPSGIFYTPTTGIWQTAWLEPVPQAHLTALRILSDIDAGVLSVVAAGTPGAAQTVEVTVCDSGHEVGGHSGAVGTAIAVPLAHAKLWWPDAPFLYDLRIDLKDAAGRVCDSVTSYAGLRAIAVGPGADGRTRMLLNHTAVLQIGLLDQGFWPDGVYTAPSDAALRSDLEATRRLGCNMLRKHVKVEPDRWYYWADRLGVLVWQDMPGCPELAYHAKTASLDDIEGNYESELRRMVTGLINHPSIIVWVPFNEGWGLPLAPNRKPGEPDAMAPEGRAREQRMVAAIRAEDPTRLIDAESGAGGGANQGANLWDAGLGDIIDYHCYGGDAPRPEAGRASVIGEAGWGLALVASIRGRLATSQQLGESAIVITQLTDVENETNGALTYDRREKEDAAAIGEEVVKCIRAAGYGAYPR